MYVRTIDGLGQSVSRQRSEAQILDRLRKHAQNFETEIDGQQVVILLDRGVADKPYIPLAHPESREYWALSPDDRAKVAATVNRAFKQVTMIDRKLDPKDPKDKPWIRIWLTLRDVVMRSRPKAAPTPALLWFTKPLPPSEFYRFEKAIKDLEGKVSATQDPRRWRYLCWIEKLKNPGTDDRVVGWSKICPKTSGAVGAAFAVGPCDITQSPPVDQAELERSIRTVNDVKRANQSLEFITYARSAIVVAYEMTSQQLENLRMVTDDAGRAIENLDKWANAPMGGSSAMPYAYRAIKDWIMKRQKDPNSLYSCR